MKIIIFDDDPTGSQSVYGCPLLLSWDINTLLKAVDHPSPLIFILANTRSLSPDLADQRIREICINFSRVCTEKGFSFEDFYFISRGDSTLRGHGIIEPSAISAILGPFNATFHIPAFLEGGRTTVNSIHLLNDCPVHLTDFALDSIFGYSSSYLPDWLEEKSQGDISALSVRTIDIGMLELALDQDIGFNKLLDFILSLENNQCVVVDAQNYNHLDIFVKAIRSIDNKERFLFRSAASFIKSLSELPLNKKNQLELISSRLKGKFLDFKPGIVVVGSHVQLADKQLIHLLREPSCEGIELPVQQIAIALNDKSSNYIISELQLFWRDSIREILTAGRTPVIYTTRGEIPFENSTSRMKFGLDLANIIATLVGEISSEIGYLISKGGITTQIILENGLHLKEVYLAGQILPGLSMVITPKDSKISQLPVITFPGNLGDEMTLLNAWKIMEANSY